MRRSLGLCLLLLVCFFTASCVLRGLGGGDRPRMNSPQGSMGGGLAGLYPTDTPAPTAKPTPAAEPTPSGHKDDRGLPGRPRSDDPPPGMEKKKGEGPPDVPPGWAKKDDKDKSGDKTSVQTPVNVAAAPTPTPWGFEAGGNQPPDNTTVVVYDRRPVVYSDPGGSYGVILPALTRWGVYITAAGFGFTEDLGRIDYGLDGSDFTAGAGWGAGLGFFWEFKDTRLAVVAELERYAAEAKAFLLSEGPFRMTPFWILGDLDFRLPSLGDQPRSRTHLFGDLGMGVVFVGHTLSQSVQDAFTAKGLTPREEPITGFGFRGDMGLRYELTDNLEVELAGGMRVSQHLVQFTVTNNATSVMSTSQSEILAGTLLGKLGVRWLF